MSFQALNVVVFIIDECNVNRQTVPGCRSRVRESAFSDEELLVFTWCWWMILANCGLADVLSLLASHWCNVGCNHVGIVHHYAQLVNDPTPNWKSVEVTYRCTHFVARSEIAYLCRQQCSGLVSAVQWLTEGGRWVAPLQYSRRLVTNAETTLLIMVGPSIQQTAVFSELIAHLANCSFMEDSFPDIFIQAQVPLLKRDDLDKKCTSQLPINTEFK